MSNIQLLLKVYSFLQTFNEISDFHVRPLTEIGFAPQFRRANLSYSFLVKIIFEIWILGRKMVASYLSNHKFWSYQENHYLYTVKPVKSNHSKKDKTKILMTNGSLKKVESIAECSPWSILQYFWPALSDNLCWKPIFVIFESGGFRQVLLYQCFILTTLYWLNPQKFWICEQQRL